MFEEEENEVLERNIEENPNNIVYNQEQVTTTLPVKVEYRTKAAAVTVENGPTKKSLN